MYNRSLIAYLTILALLCAGFVAAMRALGQQGNYLAQYYMLTPALAAILTRLFFHPPHFKDANVRFGNWRHWLLFWGLALAIVALYFALYTIAGAVRWDFSGQSYIDQIAQVMPEAAAGMRPGPELSLQLWLFAAAGLTVLNLFPGLILGFGEEFGARGLMFPALYRIRPWLGIVVGGLIWYAWHLPLTLVLPAQATAQPAWQQVLNLSMGLIGGICTHTFLAYAYVKTRNILVASLAHITINNGSHALAYFCTITDPLLGNLMTYLAMVIVVALLYLSKEHRAFAQYFAAEPGTPTMEAEPQRS